VAAAKAGSMFGLIHRDIKPQNILITSVGDFAYLIDFGIAESRGDTRLTMAGSAIGSFAYMAPERFEDRPTTPAVDTYSLAGVLYEALTGQAPFKASSIEQVIAAHVSSPPPRPSGVNPRVPAALDDVIARGMAKEPDDRYGSPGALGRAAERALTATPSPRPNAGPARFAQADPVNVAMLEHSGPTLAAWQVAQPDSPSLQRASSSQGRPWLLPAVIIAGTALILSGIGLAIGLLAQRHANPPTNAIPSSGDTVASAAPSYQRESPPSPLSPGQPSPRPSDASTPGIASVPGTDKQGWISYPAARCDPGTKPAAVARTTQSVLVVCEIQPGSLYYRGVRLSDGASIELANAVRSSVGFDVTNPTDGTQYQIRPTTLTIAPPDGQASTEPVLEYSSS
jgi:serine/threonine protein kinase